MANATQEYPKIDPKKTNQMISTLGELVEKHNFDEAWTIAGQLNSLLREQAENLNGAQYSALESIVKSYYSLNEQYKKFNQRTYAFARKANDVAG